MSLKAKIEAVIYASEDPVTLAQLIGLLGHEAQQELDRERSAQQDLDLSSASGNTAVQQEPSPDEALPQPAAPPKEPAAGAPEIYPETPELAPVADPGANQPDPYATEAQVAELQAAEGAAAPGVADLTAATAHPTPKQAERALREYFRRLLDHLIRDYATGDRGLEIREVAGGFRLATKPEYHDAVRGFVKSLKPPLKLTLQALETLAVIAYKQPVTAPEISEIRGVDSGGVLGSLMTRKLITTAGRKQVIGRPILYKTTRDFLLRFGLKDVSELPSIEEFEKMAGELAEAESLQEEIPMASDAHDAATHTVTGENLEAEKDAHEPQADGEPYLNEPVPSAATDGRISSVPPNYDAPAETDTSAQEAEVQESGR